MSTFQCCTVVFVQDAICFTLVERGAPRAGILYAVCCTCSSNSPSNSAEARILFRKLNQDWKEATKNIVSLKTV